MESAATWWKLAAHARRIALDMRDPYNLTPNAGDRNPLGGHPLRGAGTTCWALLATLRSTRP
jgi:hypothetical protein